MGWETQEGGDKKKEVGNGRGRDWGVREGKRD